MSPRVWITRTQPQAQATAERVRQKGFEPVVAPVLEARALADVNVALEPAEVLAFTSGHAVRAFAALSTIRDRPVFTVGDRTAEIARQARFADVRSAAGDAEALADMVAAAGVLRVLHPRAVETAADLAALLAARGVAARSVAVYETTPTALAAPPADVAFVLVHSPKAARRVADLLRAGAPARIGALCISQAAAAPLDRAGLGDLRWPAFPNEASLLDLLDQP